MRILKIIAGLGCFIAALFPGLLVLGELNFGFNLQLAVCTLGLVGAGYFLITRRNLPMKKTKILIVPIVCLLIGFVIVIVIPNFVRATQETAANGCIVNLRQIEAGKEQWALEHNAKTNDVVTENDIKPYIKLDSNGNLPKCPAGGTYIIGRVGEDVKCSIGTSAWPNSHVLPEDDKDNWWTDFKAAYSILFGLRQVQKP
jgi:competence protein ComGC